MDRGEGCKEFEEFEESEGAESRVRQLFPAVFGHCNPEHA
jgi:hypothetical protein